MTGSLAETPCPACDAPVFEKGSVVLCSRCDVFQHAGCWSKAQRCAATQKCKGKAMPVAVVKLQPPGPTAAEIADAVEARTQELVHPLVADLRTSMAHGEDLESLRQALNQTAEAMKERIEKLRQEIETRTEKVRVIAAAIESRAAAAPPPLDRSDLARAATEIREGADGTVKAVSASIETQVADLRRALSTELHEVLLAIEACRWDTGSRRHPLPWDGRTDDVLDPRPGSGRVVQGGAS